MCFCSINKREERNNLMECSIKYQLLSHLIDQAIYESEKEIEDGAEAVDAETVFEELEKKYFG